MMTEGFDAAASRAGERTANVTTFDRSMWLRPFGNTGLVVRLVADGAWLLPSFVRKLHLPDTEMRAVYVVQRTEADVEAALIPRRGGLPLEDCHRLMNRRIFQYGALLADEARAHDLAVVEALPFESLLDRARTSLLLH
jgi:hypothetical protein